MKLLASYDEVVDRLGPSRALLLGNGFSIGFDDRFRYRALRERTNLELPEIARDLFERLGTSSFEVVMEVLESAGWVNRHYGGAQVDPQIDDDVAATRHAMVAAIEQDHVPGLGHGAEREGDTMSTRVDVVADFLDRFDRVFTTNYDLLLYWCCLAAHQRGRSRWRDGFLRRQGDAFGTFTPDLDVRLFFLHGALHLYEHAMSHGGDLTARKRVRSEERSLRDLVREMIGEKSFPLVIAEGSAERKLQRIRANRYLSAAFDAFGRLEGDLVVYGHRLGLSDRHLLRAMIDAEALETLFVGLYDDPESPGNLETRAAIARLEQEAGDQAPETFFFPSQTAPVWTRPD
ncbi:MAG: DUF4917 family protein [Acidobacteriota bacterium]